MTQLIPPSSRTSRKLSVGRFAIISFSACALLFGIQQLFTSRASDGRDFDSASRVNRVLGAMLCTTDPVVINNSDSGPGSLRQGIVDACDASTITFNMASVTSPISLTSATLTINKNLNIVGPGINSLTIERSTAPATPQFRVFTISPAVTVSISGLTITRGRAPDTSACGATFFDGGGINNEGTLTLTSVGVTANTSGDCTNNPSTNFAPKGGGIANFGTLTITSSLISGNTTGLGPATGFGGNGGGIFNAGMLTITDTTISLNTTGSAIGADNVSGAGTGGDGAGIYNTGKLSLIHSDITQNTAGRGGEGAFQGAGNGGEGGGIYIWASSGANTVTIDNSNISNNHAGDSGDGGNGHPSGGSGGGIRVQGGTVNIINTVISGNGAGHSSSGTNGWGGGIHNDSGVITVTGTTISNNSGAANGGGVSNVGPSWLTLTNSTISGNQSLSSGGGIYDDILAKLSVTNCTITNNSSSANVGNGITGDTSQDSIGNTIIAGNGISAGASDVAGTFTSSGHNLIGNADGSSGFNGSGDLVGNAATPINAGLGPLANNGGPTQTHPLLESSPALDAGDNSLIVAPPFIAAVPISDQRGTGFPRILDGPDANATQTVDIGAFEIQVSLENISDKSTNQNTQLQFSFNVADPSVISSVTATSHRWPLMALIALVGAVCYFFPHERKHRHNAA